MSKKVISEQRLDLSSQRKVKASGDGGFESLKDKLAKRLRMAEEEGVLLSQRHLNAFPLEHDEVTSQFVDDWKKSR